MDEIPSILISSVKHAVKLQPIIADFKDYSQQYPLQCGNVTNESIIIVYEKTAT